MPINLYSDTQTRPTEAMRAAMASAEVGDEQRREDPTVLALEERVAQLLGHEAALFLPSGTMCNEIAVRLHIRPGGDEAFFVGARTRCAMPRPAARPRSRGAVITVVDGDGGMFTAAGARAGDPRTPGPATATRRARGWCASSRPTNLGGGRIWPLGRSRDVLDVAPSTACDRTSTARG